MSSTLGVVICRIQIDEPHSGHHHIINLALKENDTAVVLLGHRDLLPTHKNPLPGHLRVAMLAEEFPTLAVIELLPDHPSDAHWSATLDTMLLSQFPQHDVTLYCSRDGFKSYYSGQFPVKEIPAVPSPTGTEVREEIKQTITDGSKDFRRGWIAGVMARPPIDFSTVDIGIVDTTHSQILLGQKTEDGDQWRLPGNFTQPTDHSRQDAAMRAITEECGPITAPIQEHLGDWQIADWRYHGESDGIRTDLYLAHYQAGTPVAGNNLTDLRWFPLADLPERLITIHQTLGIAILEALNQGHS